jgi:hypothetical protein
LPKSPEAAERKIKRLDLQGDRSWCNQAPDDHLIVGCGSLIPFFGSGDPA